MKKRGLLLFSMENKSSSDHVLPDCTWNTVMLGFLLCSQMWMFYTWLQRVCIPFLIWVTDLVPWKVCTHSHQLCEFASELAKFSISQKLQTIWKIGLRFFRSDQEHQQFESDHLQSTVHKLASASYFSLKPSWSSAPFQLGGADWPSQILIRKKKLASFEFLTWNSCDSDASSLPQRQGTQMWIIIFKFNWSFLRWSNTFYKRTAGFIRDALAHTHIYIIYEIKFMSFIDLKANGRFLSCSEVLTNDELNL